MSKIIFFDIDGTLYDSRIGIPESTVNALNRLIANEHKIVMSVEIWEKNQFGNLNVFVLFKDVKQIKELADKGVKFDEITLGNMSIIGDRKQIYKSTGFTEEEAQTLFDLEKDGVKLYFQTQPTDKKESLDIVKKTFPNVQ